MGIYLRQRLKMGRLRNSNKMGTYGISIHEMVEVMAEALDKLEGDIYIDALNEALEKMKKYPYVSDKEINDGNWRKYIDS